MHEQRAHGATNTGVAVSVSEAAAHLATHRRICYFVVFFKFPNLFDGKHSISIFGLFRKTKEILINVLFF